MVAVPGTGIPAGGPRWLHAHDVDARRFVDRQRWLVDLQLGGDALIVTAFIYFIIPVRLRLWTLAKGLFVIQLVFALAGVLFHILPEGMQIAYFAHLGGAALGWFYARSLGYGGRPMTYAGQWQQPQAQRLRKPEMARARVRPAVDLEKTPGPAATARPADPIEALIEDEVNPILDKIGLHGIGSLSHEERRTLERASRELERRKQGA